VNHSVSRSGDVCQRCKEFPPSVQRTPLCMCVLPPAHESADVQVVVGTAEGPVLLVDRHEVKDLNLEEGPYMAFAASSSGRFLACLSEKGVFKVLSIGDDAQVLDTANIECRQRPKQMVWCGDDCIALYLAMPTPSNSMQHMLFVGGPQNDWIVFQYDTPLHLVSECDGCRIIGAHKVEFVQRVPKSTEVIYSIGNCDPPAMLCYAVERYQNGDVCAQESLRLIKDDLGDAVATCIDAAQHEHEPETVTSLLEAAVFGRHFLSEQPDPAKFVETCRDLRICIELRKPPLDIPLTVPQLTRMGMDGLIERLVQRRCHFLAVRLCEWVRHPMDRVLFHWACEKIKHARSTETTDKELCDAVLEKFKGCPSIDYAKVARHAAEQERPHLATRLLDHEPRSHAQVQVLLQLSREGDEDNKMMMLRLAVEKAALSWDPDLLNSVLTTACGGDICGREVDTQALVKLVQERPSELQAVSDAFIAAVQRAELHDRSRAFFEQLGRTRQAACCAVQQVFRERDAESRAKRLRYARDLFGQVDGAAHEVEKQSMLFCAQSSSDEAELLKAQIALEEASALKRWRNGPHRFAGASLVDTLCRLIEIEEIIEADNLRAKLKLSDKRYWRIKVRALSEANNMEQLNMFAKNLTSPIGYEVFIDAFLKHNRNDLAMPFMPQVKNLEQRARFYERMGMHEEANATLAQDQQQGGAGRLLKNLFGR